MTSERSRSAGGTACTRSRGGSTPFGTPGHPTRRAAGTAAEVSEAVVALALIEVGIEFGALGRRWGRWQLVLGELLSLVRGAIHHLVLRAEGRGLAATHQAGCHQHIQVVRVVVAQACEKLVAADAAAV